MEIIIIFFLKQDICLDNVLYHFVLFLIIGNYTSIFLKQDSYEKYFNDLNQDLNDLNQNDFDIKPLPFKRINQTYEFSPQNL